MQPLPHGRRHAAHREGRLVTAVKKFTDTQVMRNRRMLREAEERRARMLINALILEVSTFVLIITMELIR